MSVVKLLNCLKHDKIKFNSPPSIIFADLRESSDNVMTYNIAAANKFVSEIQRSTDIHVSSLAYISTPKKRKRDEYGEYSPDTRAKLARHCIDNSSSSSLLFLKQTWEEFQLKYN